ncbi:MAG: DUF6062 family protein [Candidatus Ornithomonoglobus sp.]
MKEKIYTIPVNEAYDKDCECPLCELEKQQEKEAVSYALGAAMMEPDYRMESNEKGYCNRHFAQMFEAPNKLPLALVLDTHLIELRKKLERLEKTAKSLEKEKAGLFKKSGADKAVAEIDEILGKTECSCMVCEKVNHNMEKFIDVLIYLWATEPEFREKFDKSKGVCLKHFKMLADYSKKSVKDEQAAKFLGALIDKEIAELNRIQKDVHKFTLKFDYRNRDMEWGTAKDAPIRTIEKISGYIINDYEEEN